MTDLLGMLDSLVPGGASARELDRYAMAHDASHYLLVPDAVVTPASADQVARLLAAGRSLGRPMTFRSGGTSLSGQGLTDGILLDTRRHFRAIEVLDDGARVRVQPGVTVRQVNARLARFGRKLGPDPASESACTIGGVIANNSSGMACGTEFNTYRTLESMILVLPSGTVINTAAPDADARLRALEPDVHRELAVLRDRVLGNSDSVRTIERLFSMKNTMGYGLNAFVDCETPVDILAHLMIGSEGTLGFVAEAVFRTVAALPDAATGLLVFPSLRAATGALADLVASGFATIELMDATSLRVAQTEAGAPAEIASLQVSDHAALLVEHQAASADELAEHQAASGPLIGSLELASPFAMTTDRTARAALWHVRKGLYTAVAAGRPSGTNALLEDIAVPVPALLEACEALTVLFDAHGYEQTVIFGHAKDGNIHFMLNERFDRPELLARYRAFTEDMVSLVLDAGGVLKAEHGTGRIMAPFVARQYGDELYQVTVAVKRLVDPAGLLNPGVVVAASGASYTNNLKTALPVEDEVDRCVECGYCEPVCPSKDITMTPRQRIVIRREIASAEAAGDVALAAALRKQYDYDGVQTCAVDGMCQTACPVLINTGDLVRRLRAENANPVADAAWGTAAKHWDAATRAGGLALTVAKAVPAPVVTAATTAARAVLGAETVPRYDGRLPGGGRVRKARVVEAAAAAEPPSAFAVYFPACIGTMFGPAAGGEGVTSAFLALAERAGVPLLVPEQIGSLCCGTPWKSKGMLAGYQSMSDRVLASLWEASGHGELQVVCDASSCTEGLLAMQHLAADAENGVYAALLFVDSVDFAAEHFLEAMSVTEPVVSVALHPTCSSTQLGSNAALERIAAAISGDVVTPLAWQCCAFAGDRGMLHPELTASATADEAAEVSSREFAAYASTNRTCELGMSRATGHEYQHILELLEQATRPAAARSVQYRSSQASGTA